MRRYQDQDWTLRDSTGSRGRGAYKEGWEGVVSEGEWRANLDQGTKLLLQGRDGQHTQMPPENSIK